MQEGHHVTGVHDLVGTDTPESIKNDREWPTLQARPELTSDSIPGQDAIQLVIQLVCLCRQVKSLLRVLP
jgi:hypothetical protein